MTSSSSPVSFPVPVSSSATSSPASSQAATAWNWWRCHCHGCRWWWGNRKWSWSMYSFSNSKKNSLLYGIHLRHLHERESIKKHKSISFFSSTTLQHVHDIRQICAWVIWSLNIRPQIGLHKLMTSLLGGRREGCRCAFC